jgi:uncharacterized protein YbjT (DUF2867 family)
MNVLLAGASGLVGFEVLQLLHGRGDDVRTVSRDTKRAERLKPFSKDVRIADAALPGALVGMCDGIEVVISALGAPVAQQAKEKRSFTEVDVAANLALIGEAKRAGVKRFVYLSVSSDASTAATPYIAAHLKVEEALAASEIPWAAVKPTGIFGALGEFVGMARKGSLPVIGGGAAKTNPIHEREVAQALVNAISGGAQLVEVGGPETLTRREIAQQAFISLGKKPSLIPVPRFMMVFGAMMLSLFNARLSQFLKFVAIATTQDCIAPVAGSLRLKDYFDELAKRA